MSGAELPALAAVEFVGLVGAAIFVTSYLLMALGRIGAGEPTYYALNFAGIALALISQTASFNPASLVIQLFVLGISALGVLRHVAHRGTAHGGR